MGGVVATAVRERHVESTCDGRSGETGFWDLPMVSDDSLSGGGSSQWWFLD